MDNNFGIKLNANVDELALKTNIESFFSKNTFKIKVDIDTSNLGNKFSSGGQSSKGSGATGLVKSRAAEANSTINLVGNEEKLTVVLDENNKQVSARVDRLIDLNKKSTEYYDIAEDGEITLKKTIATTNLGRKETLKLQERNKASAYKLQKAIESYGNQTKLSKKEVTNFNNELGKINELTDEIAKSKALEKLNTDIKTAANSSGILGQSFGKAMIKYVTWLGIATLVATITNTIKKMVEQVKILDDALVELNKVFDASKEQLNAVKDQSFEIAKQLGATGEEVIKATTEFKRMGYTIDESLELAKVAIMMTNVAEGIDDAGEAANILTSILKGTNTEIEYANSLLDRLNEVSNNNAVSFDALAEMTQEAAATMKLLGNNLDQTMGLLTGAYEVLQDESVARGIQTIGLRIAGLNEDMESVAGLSNQVVEALQKYAGVSAFDEQTGQLKNTYTILEELADVWETIDKNKQSALLNTLAGKQQADVAAAILNNWKGVQSAVEDAANSMGSALDEQEAYLNSIEGRMNQIKNLFQEFADKVIGSESIKKILDVFISLVEPIASILVDLFDILDILLELGGVYKTLERAVDIVTTVANAVARLTGFIKDLFGWIKKLGDTKIVKWLKKIGDGFEDLWDNTKVFLGLAEIPKDTTDALAQSNKDLAETYGDAADNLSEYDKAVNKLKTDLSALIETNKEKIETLKEEQKNLKNQKDLQKKLLEVEKARQALAEAKNRKIRVYRSGMGFVYAEDSKELQTAQEELQNAIDELSEFKYDLALDRTEEFIEDLNELLTNGDIIEGWDELFTNFGDLLDTQFAEYILKAEEFIKEFNSKADELSKEPPKTETTTQNPEDDPNWGRVENIVDGGDDINWARYALDPLYFTGKSLNMLGKGTKKLWKGAKKLFGFAKGTDNAPEGVSMVGEEGPELRVLNRGDGIIPSQITRNLMEIGKNPSLYLKSQGKSTVLQFNGPLNFPNVTSEADAEGFINELISIGNNGIPKLT